jgi:hypothetical protein
MTCPKTSRSSMTNLLHKTQLRSVSMWYFNSKSPAAFLWPQPGDVTKLYPSYCSIFTEKELFHPRAGSKRNKAPGPLVLGSGGSWASRDGGGWFEPQLGQESSWMNDWLLQCRYTLGLSPWQTQVCSVTCVRWAVHIHCLIPLWAVKEEDQN